MTKIKIITDSSVTIEKDLREELDISIIPLSVMVDGKLYDDSRLQDGEFLELMKSSRDLPKTSQPPVGLFAEIYDSLAGEDVEILSIHLSHSLSGTVEAARQGATLSQARVTVVDSGFTDQAMKFQVVEAAKLAKSGADMPTILEKVEEIAQKTQLFIGVSTLENLVKGGRIGRVQGLLSSLLNIKVVMEMSDHTLYPVAKGRGSKIFNKWLTNFKVDLAGKEVVELAISYSGQPDFAKDLADELAEFVPQAITVLETGSIIQTHTGEGAWAILVRYD